MHSCVDIHGNKYLGNVCGTSIIYLFFKKTSDIHNLKIKIWFFTETSATRDQQTNLELLTERKKIIDSETLVIDHSFVYCW